MGDDDAEVGVGGELAWAEVAVFEGVVGVGDGDADFGEGHD